MRKLAAALLGIATLAAPPASFAQDDAPPDGIDAQALLDRAFRNLYAEDYVQTVRIATRTRGGSPLERKLQITRLQSERPGKAMVRFLEPHDIRRTSVLILERDVGADDLYVYLPALRRTRRLSASQRADSFFGTDLSYEDIEPKHASDYVAQLEGWSDEPGGTRCAVIDIRARPAFDSTYERMRSCIEPERAVIVWTDFHRKGRVIKRLEIDPADVREIGSRHIPFAVTMRTPKRSTETTILTESYELSTAVPDSLFSTMNLEAGNARHDRSRSLRD